MTKLIGLTIVAIKGYKPSDGRTRYINPEFIFFDDKETYIEFSEQDYYSYHDCASSARHINVYKNKENYKNLMNNLVDATMDF